MFNNVDLPEPDFPTIETNPDSGKEILMSFKTTFSFLLTKNDFLMCSKIKTDIISLNI